MQILWARPMMGLFMFTGLAQVACSSVTAPELVSGVYPLIRYDGHDVPYNLGPGDPKGDNPPQPCGVLLAEGRMEVFVKQGTFALSYDYRSVCTNELMSSVGLQGQYVVVGSDVTYLIAGVGAEGSGLLTRSTISFHLGDLVLLFSRR